MHLTSRLRTILYKGSFIVTRKNLMTTSRKMQEVLDDLKKNPYYDKYAGKIAQLQKEDPSSLLERIEEKTKVDTRTIKPPDERDYSKLLEPKTKILESVQTKQESLEKIMKIDLIKDKNPDEIKTIWEQYHIQKDYTIAAIIPSTDFDRMIESSQKYPLFLFPLPRSQGFEFIMCQFSENTVHFTPLLYYQIHKENAPECLTLTHYDDLKDSKGIVLMRGEYDTNIIDAKEAQCLVNQLQMYYIQDEPEKKHLLEIFTKKPDEFKHMDLIKQLESLSIK